MILAQGPGSLGAARVLGRRGVPVVAVLWDAVTPIRYSRFVRQFIRIPPGPDPEREAHLLQRLTRLGQDRPVLRASSDRLIAFVARHQDALAPHFATCVPAAGLIESLNDKAQEVALVASLGFAVPKTLSPVPPSAAEVEAQLGLPVIVKPRSFRHLALLPDKNAVLRDRRSLETLCRAPATHLEGLVAQEVIPGPDEASWVCSGTFDRAPELLDCGIKNKHRMLPAHYGGSTCAESAANPAVLELARRLGRALRYTGHAGIEFRWDARDGRYKYIELNPRLPHNVEFDAFCGLPTVWNTYRVALDEPTAFVPGRQRDGLLYLELIDDLKARLQEGQRPRAMLADYLRLLPRRKGGVYFAWDDPVPGLWMGWRVMRAGLRRLRAGRVSSSVGGGSSGG